jgi:Flp pilus assembly pilin Flp
MFTKGSIKFRKHFAALARGESGQAMVEYGLILALVSLAAVALSPFGQAIAQLFNDIAVAI